MGGKPRLLPDGMSISSVVCKPQSAGKDPKCELIAFTSATPKPILRGVNSPDSNARTPHPLAELRRGEAAVVSGLSEVAGFEDGHGSGAVVLARLRDLGFVAGAHCEVIAKMWPVGDPMVVRVGGSTFALHRRRPQAMNMRQVRVACRSLSELTS